MKETHKENEYSPRRSIRITLFQTVHDWDRSVFIKVYDLTGMNRHNQIRFGTLSTCRFGCSLGIPLFHF
jgi:hypothetical protein